MLKKKEKPLNISLTAFRLWLEFLALKVLNQFSSTLPVTWTGYRNLFTRIWTSYRKLAIELGLTLG